MPRKPPFHAEKRPARSQGEGSSRGSVLVIVMITLLFTATAFVAFLDKASGDLLVESRRRVAQRLRMDAYSALEVTLAVLEDFRQADNGLHTPDEGWTDPLGWSGWTPQDGNTIEVSFEDESGKFPLIHADQTTLNNVFQYWGLAQNDAQKMTDVLMSWMQKNYVIQSGVTADYEQMAFPYDAPWRVMRSYNELAAIDFAREKFYDEKGRPTELWWRFYTTFSLFNYSHPNVNAANPGVLAAIGQFDDTTAQNISNYMQGTGDYRVDTPLGRQWFNSPTDLRGVVGQAGNVNAFGTTIEALRILITVHDGSEQLHLSVVVSPQGGARTVMTSATDARKSAASGGPASAASDASTGGTAGEAAASTGSAGSNAVTSITSSSSTPTQAQTSAAQASNKNLKYPFTILEIHENDEILTAPSLPPPTPSHT